ncbi:hypothetical protein L1276_003724 [Flavobacterium sp. HSC-32F16]|uniref:hypothetical protein n=1 Tax=Flavobacterium sp. HSC-32F16 TaxID=2910964 RepID=UPI0020A32CB2|nr:hypothetical protein [Flavobacterium sp. HSC-32F16]MCP2028554.1 hypothetical protein [Flavobacterium sp. HSC-32F16]
MEKINFYNDRELQHSGFHETRNYGYRYQDFENEKLIKDVHYEVEINCKTNDAYNDFIFEINRKQVYVNSKEPNLLVEQMLDKCAKALFPIKIIPAEDGTIYEIDNHHEIVQRWNSLKKHLSSYYYSEAAYKILNKVQKLILNKQELEKSLNQDWFFHLYFSPLYIDYPLETSQTYKWESPILGNQSIDYRVNHTIEEHYTATGKIIINATGKSIDERSIEEVLEGINYPKAKLQGIPYKTLESEMEVQYKLYGEDRSIFSIISTYETKIDETKKKVQKITLFHLLEDEDFRPESDFGERKAYEQFKNFQTMEDEDIIDISKRLKDFKPVSTLKEPQEKISLYVEEIPTIERKSPLAKFLNMFKK